MKKRIITLILSSMLILVGNAQIGIKLPTKVNVKNKSEKNNSGKEDKGKTTEVESKTPAKAETTTSSPSKQVEETKSTPAKIVSPYPKVTEPTILFSTDDKYAQPLSEIVPGEGTVYGHLVIPEENLNAYILGKMGYTYEDVYVFVTLDFVDEKGNAKIVKSLIRQGNSDKIRFDETKNIHAIVVPLMKIEDYDGSESMTRNFAKSMNTQASRTVTVPGMKSGMNTVKIKVEFGTYYNSQGLSKAKTFLNSTFKINIKDENRSKIKKYGLTTRDFAVTEDDGYSGEVHAKNLDKIVFSKEPINSNSDDLSKLSGSFKLTDDIFAGVCFAKSYKNKLAEFGGSDLANNTLDVRTFIIVDGKEYINIPLTESISCSKNTFFRLVFHDKNKVSKDFSSLLSGEKGLAYVLSQLEPGKHTVKFEMRTTEDTWKKLESGRPLLLASGEFTVEFTAAERDAYAKECGQKFEFDQEQTKDASIISLAKKGLPGAINYKIGDMIVQKNYYDKITHREGYMNAIIKNENGDYVLTTYKTTQQYVGGKWEGKIAVQYLNDYWYNVPVQNHN